MITTNFLSETPILKGKDAERFIENMANVKPLSKKQIAEIFADAEKFETRKFKKNDLKSVFFVKKFYFCRKIIRCS